MSRIIGCPKLGCENARYKTRWLRVEIARYQAFYLVWLNKLNFSLCCFLVSMNSFNKSCLPWRLLNGWERLRFEFVNILKTAKVNEPKAKSYATCAILASFFEKTVDCPNENTIWVADMDYAPFLCEKMNQKSSPLFAKLISFW